MNARWMVVLPLALLAACVSPSVVSRSPITDDEVGNADSRLAGAWEIFDEKGTLTGKRQSIGLAYLAPMRGPQLEAFWILASRLGDESPLAGAVAVVSGQVSGRWYVSVQRNHSLGKTPVLDYQIGRCDFRDEDTVQVRVLVPGAIQAAIDGGELRGRPVGNDGLRITASTEELAAWVSRQDPVAIFEPYLLLRRLRPSKPVVPEPEHDREPESPGEAARIRAASANVGGRP